MRLRVGLRWQLDLDRAGQRSRPERPPRLAHSDAEGNCHNRDEAVAFTTARWPDGVSAEALNFRDAGDRVVVVVQTHESPEWGEQPEPHGEVVTVRDGKVVEMLVYPTVEAALAAAGTD